MKNNMIKVSKSLKELKEVAKAFEVLGIQEVSTSLLKCDYFLALRKKHFIEISLLFNNSPSSIVLKLRYSDIDNSQEGFVIERSMIVAHTHTFISDYNVINEYGEEVIEEVEEEEEVEAFSDEIIRFVIGFKKLVEMVIPIADVTEEEDLFSLLPLITPLEMAVVKEMAHNL